VINIQQLKSTINQMAPETVFEAVLDLRLDGLVMEGKTPFGRLHFNTCFAEIEALFQRAGYHQRLDVVGFEGQAYALFDPARWEAMDVLRWLQAHVKAAAAGHKQSVVL
jgi:hypothetical protein